MAENNHNSISSNNENNISMQNDELENNNNNCFTQYSSENEDNSAKRPRIDSTISDVNQVSPAFKISSSFNRPIDLDNGIPPNLDNWIFERVKNIINAQHIVNHKKRAPLLYDNHVKDGTFPTDLPAVKFKGFLQYPRSVLKMKRRQQMWKRKRLLLKLAERFFKCG
jgi:hypothetical protein